MAESFVSGAVKDVVDLAREHFGPTVAKWLGRLIVVTAATLCLVGLIAGLTSLFRTVMRLAGLPVSPTASWLFDWVSLAIAVMALGVLTFEFLTYRRFRDEFFKTLVKDKTAQQK